jgi:RNA polymerase subunit RPABC4/transcription elongation factor Spt4
MGIVFAATGAGTTSSSSSTSCSSSLNSCLQQFAHIGALIGAAIGVFLVLLWLSSVVWTIRDIRSRTQDPVLQVAAGLVALVLPFCGLIIYRILRPRHTLAELYERQLEEESLLAEMTDRQTCPACHHRIENDFQVCPSCGSRLKRPCPRCERLLDMKWNLCPYCAYNGAVDGQRMAARPAAPVQQRGRVPEM